MRKAYIALLTSIVVWGINFAILKISLFEVEPITLAFFRFFIASIVLFCVVLITKQWNELKKAFKEDSLFFLMLGFFGITLIFVLQNFALQLSPTSEVAIVTSGDPIFIMILACLFIGEKLNTKKITGIILGMIGVLVVILNQADFSSLLESKSFLGNTLALMSTIAWAIYTIMSKKRVNKFKPVVVTTIASIFGSLSLLISMLIFEGVPKFSSYSVSTYMLLAYLGVVATALCLFTWNYALERLDASKVGIYMFLMPIIAIIIGVLLFQEKLTLQIITGAILVFSGIYFTEKKEQGT